MKEYSMIIERAKNLVEFARHSKDNELDTVAQEIVNFVQEQRIELLSQMLKLLKRGANEAVISERQRQETAELSKRKDL
tara:strand:+ start:322 stop:558 length:237 start_codon:yes stop_codon:yes gene_type:complete